MLSTLKEGKPINFTEVSHLEKFKVLKECLADFRIKEKNVILRQFDFAAYRVYIKNKYFGMWDTASHSWAD